MKMKTTILKGLYVVVASVFILSAMSFMSYLFVATDKLSFSSFTLEFLTYLSTMIFMGGSTVLVIFFLYSVFKDFYRKVFNDEESEKLKELTRQSEERMKISQKHGEELDKILREMKVDTDPTRVIKMQEELINVLEGQVADLTMMSKIELWDDVIGEIRRLKEALREANGRN